MCLDGSFPVGQGERVTNHCEPSQETGGIRGVGTIEGYLTGWNPGRALSRTLPMGNRPWGISEMRAWRRNRTEVESIRATPGERMEAVGGIFP